MPSQPTDKEWKRRLTQLIEKRTHRHLTTNTKSTSKTRHYKHRGINAPNTQTSTLCSGGSCTYSLRSFSQQTLALTQDSLSLRVLVFRLGLGLSTASCRAVRTGLHPPRGYPQGGGMATRLAVLSGCGMFVVSACVCTGVLRYLFRLHTDAPRHQP